jgi:hypothetical protein
MQVSRVIFVTSEKEINFSEVGAHWTSDETVLANMNSSLVGCEKGKKLILFAEIEDSMIDTECTEISNTNYPHEKEVVLNLNTELENVEIYDPSDDEVLMTVRCNTGSNCNEWVNKIHRGENID